MTDAIALRIAVQACLPVLRIGLEPYRGFVGIVVHPDEVVAAREVVDDDGVVHQYDEVLTGEAMEGGPVMLSWTDVRDAGASADWAYNVVIHEFAHVLDMADGLADGVPPMPDADDAPTLGRGARVRIRALLPLASTMVTTPRSIRTAPSGIDEFFAVAVEAFFVAPPAMRDEHPLLYALFADYFLQDPAG